MKARDLAAAERFYAGVLQLPVLRRQSDDLGERSIWVGLGGDAFLALERADEEPSRRDDDAGWHCVALAIEVAERDAWRARLRTEGHPIERETNFTLYTRDPEGALVALSHYPTPAR